jgi:hypothetical protein
MLARHTCRNQLIRTFSSTEPERITAAREVEDLESKDTRSPHPDNAHIRSELHTYARFAIVCAELLREEAIRDKIVGNLGSEQEPLRCAGFELPPLR